MLSQIRTIVVTRRRWKIILRIAGLIIYNQDITIYIDIDFTKIENVCVSLFMYTKILTSNVLIY